MLDGGPLDRPPQGLAGKSTLPRDFGPYELLEEVARGGMGIVYKARQTQINRVVAVKVMAAGEFASPDFVERFRTEAELAASLDHPNIVPIYEVGEYEGQPFFSMRFVEGGSLSDRLSRSESPFSNGEAAALLAKLAHAVQFAHQRGILHRDIKPGNILLDETGEPSLTDFGLAKLVEKESKLTRTMAMLGTPSYMSPEQARGEARQLTTAVDVYGLGAVFYELLTGQAPFAAGTTMETVQQVLEKEPRRPSALKPGTDRELEIICLKCVEKEPSRRYASAEALADDLERWERQEPVTARPASAFYVFQKMVRRNKGSFSALLIIALLLVSGVVVSTWQAGVQRELRKSAEVNERRAVEARQEANAEAEQKRQQVIRMHVAAGNKLVGQGEAFAGLLQVVEALRLEGGAAARVDVYRRRFASILRTAPRLKQLWQSGGGLLTARFSPDGARVVCADENGGVQIFDAETAEPLIAPIKTEPPVELTWFTRDGKFLVTVDTDGKLRHWDPVTGRPAGPLLPTLVASRPKRFYGDCVDYSPDGRLALAVVPEGARYFSVPTGEPVGPLLAPTNLVTCVRFSPDGRTAILCGEQPALQLLEVPSGAALWTPDDLRGRGWHGAFSPDGQRLATASGQKGEELDIWDVGQRKRTVETIRALPDPIGIKFSPDGRWLAEAHTGDAQVFEVRTGRTVGERMHHDTHVLQFEFSPDGRQLATASFDRTARVWDAASGQPLGPVLRHTAVVSDAQFSPDASQLLTLSGDGTTRLWELLGGGERLVLSHRYPGIPQIRLSPDSHSLLIFGNGDEIQVWDTRSGHVSAAWREGEGVTAACFNQDGSVIASADVNGVVRLRNSITTTEIISLEHPGAVRCLEFSPDGRTILSAGSDGSARLWSAADGTPLMPAMMHEGLVRHATFSRDGRYVVTGGDDKMVRVWDAQRRVQVGKSLELSTPVMAAALNADGSRILTLRIGPGSATQLWDATTRQPIGPEWPLLSGFAYQAAFSPDGRRFLMHQDATTVALRDARTGNRIAQLLEHRYLPGGFSFSPDGRLVVTFANRLARVWDAETGEPVSPPLAHSAFILWAGWSADGREVLVNANDGKVRVWDMSPAAGTVEELARQAELLAAHRLDAAIGMVPLTPAEMKARWREVRK